MVIRVMNASSVMISSCCPASTSANAFCLSQAGDGPDDDFWGWYRTALAHPSGRADGDESCIWCTKPVPVCAHWVNRERHVCGAYCNERLKGGSSLYMSAGVAVAARTGLGLGKGMLAPRWAIPAAPSRQQR
jgi:hypothetical protein